ncbi:MAG TPA: efflux RND transporter periplasmic adaptor subunit [Burkholderiales bacterium]|nr:efflux RND transporter periplasmic adaptor subunit [Burkholderiales bacterium]
MPNIAPQPLARAMRTLPRRTQVIIVFSIALIFAVLIGIRSFASYIASAVSNPEAAKTTETIAPGTFRPTKTQWAGLKVTAVATTTFRTERVTEGNIAINEETTTPVFSPYSGRVTKLIAKAGDIVKKGTPLMAVEASEFVQAQNDLITAVSTLNTARSQASLAQVNEKRQHEVYLARGGALKDWQQSQAELTSAQNNLRSAEIALAAVRNRLRILGRSDAEIDAFENESNSQKMNSEAIVRAPVAGTVTQRQVGLGQYINSASSGASGPLYSISNLSIVWLIANVREIDAPLMHVGEPVEVRVLAYPGRVFKAKIAWVASSVDPNTHRLPVRAEVENPDGALKPMMFANFSIITGGAIEALAVPQSAIVYEGEEARVWVARDDGTIASRSIRTGRNSDGMVEVSSGLNPGENVVTSGTLFIDRAAQYE